MSESWPVMAADFIAAMRSDGHWPPLDGLATSTGSGYVYFVRLYGLAIEIPYTCSESFLYMVFMTVMVACLS